MGSVKDLQIIQKPTKNKTGIGEFHFSDRYSVFDWGEMPDHIEAKGAALCLIAAFCFEKLENTGIKTHYRGLVTQKGETVRFEELKVPTNIMEIDLVNVIQPLEYEETGKLKYDYSVFTPDTSNYLIPLEFIYRNGLPEGSSVFKRLQQRTTTIEELGLDHYPRPGEKLAKPIFDVSTKLEKKDRYLTWQQAKEIAGLTITETEQVRNLLTRIDDIITNIATDAELENEDGKIELAFNPERKLIVIDVVGTPDECRFTYKGTQVSKEAARKYYHETKWYKDMEQAKKTADAKGIKEWKSLCKTQPPKLEKQFKRIIEEMYMAAANEITDHKFFDVHSLKHVAEEYQEYVSEKS
jgi:phosphoribosylaminoimidazole-succinocarboxamide synthase